MQRDVPLSVARFSKLGEHGAVWLAIGVAGAAVDGARRGEWLAGARRVALAYGVNQAIKVIVRRGRPADARARTLSTLSFPSAHATTAFCGARSFARLGAPAIPLYALAAGLAASRLYLRVHHPSDVLAGAVLGTALAR
ncbi:MAG TPA: phosphatase PAP2 family protein [Solirubrobacteraceae bacterium]|nr:phosphatase PAP2 family protein [Solirubrobacteraceae bacterium]